MTVLGIEGAIEVLAPEDVLGIGSGADILIVDDSDTNLIAYEAALEPLGRRLVLARSGTEALGKLLDHDFALVLLDFSMPDMTGIETARMIRDRPRCKGTPIMCISGASPSTEIMLDAYEVGALDFISKPIVPEVLRAKVSVQLRLQERTQQLLRQTALLREAHEHLERNAAAERERDEATGTAVRLEKLQEATAALTRARPKRSRPSRFGSARLPWQRRARACGSRARMLARGRRQPWRAHGVSEPVAHDSCELEHHGDAGRARAQARVGRDRGGLRT
jgi:CheY-like chemotaxis protein